MAVKTTFSETEVKEIIELYKIHRSSHKVAKVYNSTQNRIIRCLRYYVPELVIANRTSSTTTTRRKYTKNENYFDKIDTPEKAYILGFLYADGYNSETRGVVTISINIKDIDLLYHVQKELNSNFPIKTNDKNMVRLDINSKKISKLLAKWGCTQAKTFTTKFPEFLDKNLTEHFVHGYFDGDGCMYTSDNRNNAMINFAGSSAFLEGISSFLSREYEIKINPLRKHKNIHYLYIQRSLDIYKIYNIFYKKDNFFFKRKKEKFEKFFQKISPIKLIDTKDMISLYNEGKTIKEVAKHYNMSVMGVYHRLVKEDKSCIRTTKIEENKKNEIIEMIKLGFFPKDIKEKTGISNTQLYRYIKNIKKCQL